MNTTDPIFQKVMALLLEAVQSRYPDAVCEPSLTGYEIFTFENSSRINFVYVHTTPNHFYSLITISDWRVEWDAHIFDDLLNWKWVDVKGTNVLCGFCREYMIIHRDKDCQNERKRKLHVKHDLQIAACWCLAELLPRDLARLIGTTLVKIMTHLTC